MPAYKVTITIPSGASGEVHVVEAEDPAAAREAALALATHEDLTIVESVRKIRLPESTGA